MVSKTMISLSIGAAVVALLFAVASATTASEQDEIQMVVDDVHVQDQLPDGETMTLRRPPRLQGCSGLGQRCNYWGIFCCGNLECRGSTCHQQWNCANIGESCYFLSPGNVKDCCYPNKCRNVSFLTGVGKCEAA